MSDVTQAPPTDVYVVEGPFGFTEKFDAHAVDVLVRLGFIKHQRDDYVLESDGRGVGPLHHFYASAI